MPSQAHIFKFIASWADMDQHSDMANTAYLNKALDARMAFFTASGLPLGELMRRRIGGVMLKDELEYRRESR